MICHGSVPVSYTCRYAEDQPIPQAKAIPRFVAVQVNGQGYQNFAGPLYTAVEFRDETEVAASLFQGEQ